MDYYNKWGNFYFLLLLSFFDFFIKIWISIILFSTSNRNIEDITTALPLLEFINLFVEYHIERCISTSTRHSKTAAVMEVFLNELSNLTRQCTVPDYLHKLCLIWKGLFEDESAKAAVLNNENCLQAGFHIFQVGLFQYNSNLENVIFFYFFQYLFIYISLFFIFFVYLILFIF